MNKEGAKACRRDKKIIRLLPTYLYDNCRDIRFSVRKSGPLALAFGAGTTERLYDLPVYDHLGRSSPQPDYR